MGAVLLGGQFVVMPKMVAFILGVGFRATELRSLGSIKFTIARLTVTKQNRLIYSPDSEKINSRLFQFTLRAYADAFGDRLVAWVKWHFVHPLYDQLLLGCGGLITTAAFPF